MKNKSVICLITVVLIILSSCASVKEEKPLWADEATIEQIYPSEKFIARIGYSDLEKNASLYADSELSSFFSKKINSKVKAEQTLSDKKNVQASEKTLVHTVNVESVTELFAVNHTKPYFDKVSKKYVCCAYINRQEAWSIYEPKVLQAKKEFMPFYNKASEESDPFTKIKLLKNCEPSSKNYLQTLDFANLLYEAGEEKYSSDRNLISSIPEKVSSTKLNATMNVVVKNDNDERIVKTVGALLSNEGYVLQDKDFVYAVKVEVEPNKEIFAETIKAEPSVSIEIANGKKIVFSYSKKLQNVSGFKEAEALVDKKIYSSVEEEIESSFITEFNKALDL